MSILPPEHRVVFNAALQPPAGYRLARLVGTTFSLDMLSALVIPVSLEARASVKRGETAPNEVMILAALKRAASRISIFVEAGNITPFSRAAARLSALMEGCIHQVQPPKDCSFHPKIWVMHFTPLDSHAPALTRLIIMSRNLTQDRSWDAALTLDGTCVEPDEAHDNEALCEFVRYLLKHAPSDNPHDAALLKALGHTRWTLPSGFSRFDFTAHYPGSNDHWSVGRYDQLAVVSPFCTAEGLEALRRPGKGPLYLVSNDDWLARLPEGSRPERCKILAPAAMPEEDAENPSGPATDETSSGLHAKIYMVQDRTRTRLTIASGNATGPGLAFDPDARDGRKIPANIEVFATLTGPTSRCGTIGLEEDKGLLSLQGWGKLLDDWVPRPPSDAEKEAVRTDLDFWRLRQSLCAAAPQLVCKADEDGRLRLRLELPGMQTTPARFDSVHVGLATTQRRILLSGSAVDLGLHALFELSAFLCVEARHVSGETRSFVVKCEASGFPTEEERFDAVLGEVVRDADSFLRLAAALLDPELSLTAASDRKAGQVGAGGAGYMATKPLLEAMLDAYLAEDGAARIRTLTDILKRVEAQHPQWMTDEFQKLWRAFQDATSGRKS